MDIKFILSTPFPPKSTWPFWVDVSGMQPRTLIPVVLVPCVAPWTKLALFFEFSPQCIMSKELVDSEKVHGFSKHYNQNSLCLHWPAVLLPWHTMRHKAHSPASYLSVVSKTANKHSCKGPKVTGEPPGSSATEQSPSAFFVLLTYYHQPDQLKKLVKSIHIINLPSSEHRKF